MDFLHLQEEVKNCRRGYALFLLVSLKMIAWHYMRACHIKLLLYWLLKATGQIIEVCNSRLNNTKYLYIVVDYKLYKII